MGEILCVGLEDCEVGKREASTLSLVLGGLGLPSAHRTRQAVFWASWADCIPMVGARHPEVAAQLVAQLEGHPATPCLAAAGNAARALTGVMNFEPPSWHAVLLGARPPATHTRHLRTRDPPTRVASLVEENFKNVVLDRMSDSARASLRSQGGPGGRIAFHHMSHVLGDPP